MNIYLYVKTHNKTGLKYLGKTTSKDPYKYKGSGTWWINHINTHGYDVTTKIIKECLSNEELKKWGIYYSNLWNVVESKKWANLKPEEGDGGDTSQSPNFQKHAKTIAATKSKFKWWNNGVNQVHSEFQPDHTYVLGRLNFNNNGAKIGSDKQRGKVWVNNGSDEFMTHLPVPLGYKRGRKPGMKENDGLATLGTHHWTNGIKNKMSKVCPGKGWKRGRTLRSQKTH